MGLMEELVCTKCGLIQTPKEAKLTIQVMSNGTEHVRASCGDCGRWIKWIKKDPIIEGILRENMRNIESECKMIGIEDSPIKTKTADKEFDIWKDLY